MTTPVSSSRRAVLGSLAAALAVAVIPGAVYAAPRRLSGNVFYRERMALPPSARIEVSLVDVSLADAPSRVIARTSFRARGSAPFNYELRYDSDDISRRRRYALQARITDGDRLLFISTTSNPVFTGGRDNTDIRVERVSAPEAPSGPRGEWRIVAIDGRRVASREATMTFDADGSVSAFVGCNRMGGRARINGQRIAFDRMRATMMACGPVVMRQEAAFNDAISQARTWEINRRGNQLTLSGRNGSPLVELVRR
ncbi:MAG: YbaY family lipoprotein [Mesorhizobium sp.]